MHWEHEALYGRAAPPDPIFANVRQTSQSAPPGKSGVPVGNVKTALEVMSMCVALDYDCCLFIALRGCPYCHKLMPAWQKACGGEARVLWLFCEISDMDQARAYLGDDITFPCLVANGNIHQRVSTDATSDMSSSAIVRFAKTDPPESEELVVFEESPDTNVKDDDLLSQHSSEDSEESVDEASSDTASSCGSSIGENMSDDDEMSASNGGFLSTCDASSATNASPTNRVVVCYKWDACGGCKAFRPEWNRAVEQGSSVDWAVVDVDDEPEMFEQTGSATVPHLCLHRGGPPMAGGPMSTADLLQWALHA